MLHINLALIGQGVSEKTMFEYYGYIHVFCSGWEQMGPDVHFFSESLIFSPTDHFLQDFSFE